MTDIILRVYTPRMNITHMRIVLVHALYLHAAKKSAEGSALQCFSFSPEKRLTQVSCF